MEFEEPVEPDFIDHICDFLMYRFDQHLDRWQVIAGLTLAAILLAINLFNALRVYAAPRFFASISGISASQNSANGSGKAGENKSGKAGANNESSSAAGRNSAADKNESSSSEGKGAKSNATSKTIYVYVCGAVIAPAVVKMKTGDRVAAAIAAAGGAAPGADLNQLNLARKLVDGERIYIPKTGESVQAPLAGDNGSAAASGSGAEENTQNDGAESGWTNDGKLDLNRASAADLEALPGIGPAYAGRIIESRRKRGGFTNINQLTDVQGIGSKTFAKIKPFVYVE
jgi:competence protein ComEA